MAQTISVQRGSGSWTGGNTGNVYTLFTNGANPSRVIPQQLLIRRTDGTSTSSLQYNFCLLQTVSGGVSSIISMLNGSVSPPMYNIVQFPIITNYTPSTGGATSIGPYNALPIINNTSVSVSRTFENQPYNNSVNNMTGGITGLTQFYLGPSDVVKLATSGIYTAGKGLNSISGIYYYSFLLITES
jgi:hypothetical protein